MSNSVLLFCTISFVLCNLVAAFKIYSVSFVVINAIGLLKSVFFESVFLYFCAANYFYK